jgi:hypothetical protein
VSKAKQPKPEVAHIDTYGRKTFYYPVYVDMGISTTTPKDRPVSYCGKSLYPSNVKVTRDFFSLDSETPPKGVCAACYTKLRNKKPHIPTNEEIKTACERWGFVTSLHISTGNVLVSRQFRWLEAERIVDGRILWNMLMPDFSIKKAERPTEWNENTFITIRRLHDIQIHEWNNFAENKKLEEERIASDKARKWSEPTPITTESGKVYKTEVTREGEKPGTLERITNWVSQPPDHSPIVSPWPFEIEILTGGYTVSEWKRMPNGEWRYLGEEHYRSGDRYQVPTNYAQQISNVLKGTTTRMKMGLSVTPNEQWGYVQSREYVKADSYSGCFKEGNVHV